MEATERATPDVQSQTVREPAAATHVPSVHTEVAHLAALHREAEETARLANLLGRAPYAAATLAIASGLTAGLVLAQVSGAALASWLALMLIGVGAILRTYRQAIQAPFERAPLAAFVQDLSAILTYAGFAWGAGAFLILPDGTAALAALAFAIVLPALLAVLLRAHSVTLPFLASAATLCAFAMVLKPLPGGALAAALMLIATGAVAATLVAFEKLETRGRDSSVFAKLPFS